MKKITSKSLYNAAVFYLERYEASREMVRRVLKRKIMRLSPEDGQEYAPWIEEVLEKLQELNYINDRRYAENQGRLMALAGKSRRTIEQKLTLQGVDKEIIHEVLTLSDEMGTEEERAFAFIHKKHLVLTRENYQKNLAKLARAGFSYEVASHVLQNEEGQE